MRTPSGVPPRNTPDLRSATPENDEYRAGAPGLAVWEMVKPHRFSALMTVSVPATVTGVTWPAMPMERCTIGMPALESMTSASASPLSYLRGDMGVQTSENIGRLLSSSREPSTADAMSTWKLASSADMAPCWTCLEVYAIVTRNS